MDFKEGTEKETRPFVATNKTQMTLREALEYLRPPLYTTENKDKAYRNLESLVLASEQAPTLEKLGYKLVKNPSEYAVRVYDNEAGTIISFYDYVNYDGKTLRSVEKLRHKTYDEFTYEEILACAEVIKEEEKK